MKIRIGIAIGQWPDKNIQPDAIFGLVEYFEALDVDSLWVSERLVSNALILEPITFLSIIAGRFRKMKLGTSTLVLPARNPIVLAKELATLDFLSQGRLFPAIGLGGEDSKDLLAVGVDKSLLRHRHLGHDQQHEGEDKIASLHIPPGIPANFATGNLNAKASARNLSMI